MHIDKITIAVADMEKMHHFYQQVFGIKFQPVSMAGYTLQTAVVDDFELMLCPKELAGVAATINTIQLRFVVADADGAYRQAIAAGGIPITEPQIIEGRNHASFRDPDGNSLEIIAAYH